MIAYRGAGRGLVASAALSAILLVIGLWPTSAAAQYGGGGPGSTGSLSAPHGEPAANAPSTSGKDKVVLNPYETALRFKQQGNFQKAIEMLEPLAKYGHGYEVAQFNLGECYLAVAAAKTDPDEAQKSRQSGASWVIRAADAGLAQAQQELVRLALQGEKFKVEPAEAGKWYLLWKRNPTRTQLGVTEIDPVLLRKMNTLLTDADWAEANTRADAWHVTVEPGEGPAP